MYSRAPATAHPYLFHRSSPVYKKDPYATRRTETPVPAMHGRPPRMSGRREIRLPISVTVAGKLNGIGPEPLRPGRARRIFPPHSTRVGDLLQNLVLRQRAYDLAAARALEFRRARIERLVKAVPRAVPLCEAAAAILAAVDGLRAQVRVNPLVEIVAGPRRRGPAIEEPLRPRLALVRHLVAGADVPAGRDAEIVVCHAAEVLVTVPRRAPEKRSSLAAFPDVRRAARKASTKAAVSALARSRPRPMRYTGSACMACGRNRRQIKATDWGRRANDSAVTVMRIE